MVTRKRVQELLESMREEEGKRKTVGRGGQTAIYNDGPGCKCPSRTIPSQARRWAPLAGVKNHPGRVAWPWVSKDKGQGTRGWRGQRAGLFVPLSTTPCPIPFSFFCISTQHLVPKEARVSDRTQNPSTDLRLLAARIVLLFAHPPGEAVRPALAWWWRGGKSSRRARAAMSINHPHGRRIRLPPLARMQATFFLSAFDSFAARNVSSGCWLASYLQMGVGTGVDMQRESLSQHPGARRLGPIERSGA
ncbi:hypothetical protein MAPG_02472 [Magnaporthiopsis poae ATCC 64411]|uniref:Uncharacterized protein n=1 Tax=Magnaporthiopsis poae (strain ATCC 64411 / 73-15) TaxID=644358 RepID=A0A0C4DRG4_MAGP6|nr:hypothetical protein MAPG_02472 [Magnaporthiopsis poae ATCC 64411]